MEVSGTGSHVMQQSHGILNSESMHAEQCGGTEFAYWTEASLVTALLFAAALVHCDMQDDTT